MHTRLLFASGLVLAGLSALWPPAALPAVVALVLLVVISSGAMRWVAAVAGGLLVMVGGVRFIIEYVAPNVVIAGRRAAEDKAVSRLREIRWAQQRGREMGLASSGEGGGRYLFLREMLQFSDQAPLLQGGFRAFAAEDGVPVYKRDGYLFAVFLPGQQGAWVDEGEALAVKPDAQRWLAFAWPETEGAGSRVFFIDHRERICETEGGFLGVQAAPRPDEGPPFETDDCGEAGLWRPWKGKKPLTGLP